MTDVLFHWLIDMSGAATFACILKGCSNSEHKHTRAIRWIANHKWITQSLVALVIAIITVRMIG